MTLVRYNPFRELQDLQKTMNRFFGETLTRVFDEPENEFIGNWSPVVDIYETEDEVNLTAELPGFEKDEVNLSVHDGRLTISGERKFTGEQKTRNYHQVERWYGRFSRSFVLPAMVDYNHISASLKNGLLTITVPKKEEAKPKQISVAVQ
ncbi:MAG: Hsp20/alpha crystallin family protein [Acidobacteria bacterium]|nr:Hsp20/alpha crystallin family protein [Acidobacteriota bacterium]